MPKEQVTDPLQDAQLLKWIQKALQHVPYLPLYKQELQPMAERMLAHLETDSDQDGVDSLEKTRAKATVLYTLSFLQCQYNSDKLFATIDRLQELHERFPEDVVLLRCFVKILTVFSRFDYG